MRRSSPVFPPAPGLAALAAFACWVLALLGCRAALPLYSQLHYPVALLGARGVPGAGVFNAFGFALPGLLAAVAAAGLRGRVAAHGWSARIGSQLLLLSALAFATQGLAPLDAGDLDAPASRLHATVWSLWWIAGLAGGALLSLRVRRAAQALVAALSVVALAALAGYPALAQRIAIAGFLLLPALARPAQP